MANLAKKLSKRLKQLRGNQTQREFARRLNIDQGTLNRLEQATHNITLKTLQNICDRLKCSIGWLFMESD